MRIIETVISYDKHGENIDNNNVSMTYFNSCSGWGISSTPHPPMKII